MRRAVLLLAVPFVVPALFLAACDRRHTEETTTTVTKDGTTTTTVTTRKVGKRDADDAKVSGLTIDSDKFKANIEIPGMSFGADHMDIDGMKLYPGSKVKAVRVHARDRDGDKQGTVTMDFTSPATPPAVAVHMAAEAKKAGFAVTGVSPAGLSGTKTEDKEANHFTVTLNANGDATLGQLTMTGSKGSSGWN